MKAAQSQYKPSRYVSFCFEAVYSCQLEKWVKQVPECVMNGFNNGLYGHKTTKNQLIWHHGLPEIMNSFTEEEGMSILMQMKMKGSLMAFSKQFA